MSTHLPVLTIVLPLLAAFFTPWFGQTKSKWPHYITVLTQIAGLVVTSALFRKVVFDGITIRYHLGGWIPPWGIEYIVDPLAAGFLLLISLLALLTTLYLSSYEEEAPFQKNGVFYALFLILNAGLMGMVITEDLFNFYVFLEISALSAYGLLSASGDLSVLAVFRYLLVGTIGASFYLLGLGYLYASTGTLNMADLAHLLPTLLESRSVLLGLGMIVTGLAIKTALFPLHGWMPDTYTYASPAVLGFVAAVMTKVGGYALIRFFVYIFPPQAGVDVLGPILQIASWGAILVGSSMAIAQTDLRRMLAYSSVAQLGFIVLGIALNSDAALVGAFFHILMHALMKGGLFFIAGGIGMRLGTYQIDRFKGLSKVLPFASLSFVIFSLSMIGLPPLGGFFSKWYLLLGAFDQGNFVSIGVMLIGSLLTAIYLFRIIELFYFSKSDQTQERRVLPFSMLASMGILAILILAFGLFNQSLVTEILEPMLRGGSFGS